MILIDCPSCDHSIPVELPLAATIQCEDCSTAWQLAEPDRTEAQIAA